MKVFDIVVNIIFSAVILAFIAVWGCDMDIYVTCLAGILLVVSVVITLMQVKKMKKLGKK